MPVIVRYVLATDFVTVNIFSTLLTKKKNDSIPLNIVRKIINCTCSTFIFGIVIKHLSMNSSNLNNLLSVRVPNFYFYINIQNKPSHMPVVKCCQSLICCLFNFV